MSKITQLVSDKEITRILLMAVLTEIGMKILVDGWEDTDISWVYILDMLSLIWQWDSQVKIDS